MERFKADPEKALRAVPGGRTFMETMKPLPMMMPAPASAEDGEIDPVCGMTVQPGRAAGLRDLNRRRVADVAPGG